MLRALLAAPVMRAHTWDLEMRSMGDVDAPSSVRRGLSRTAALPQWPLAEALAAAGVEVPRHDRSAMANMQVAVAEDVAAAQLSWCDRAAMANVQAALTVEEATERFLKQYHSSWFGAPSTTPSLHDALRRASSAVVAISERTGYISRTLWNRLMDHLDMPCPPLVAWRLKIEIESLLLSRGSDPEVVRRKARFLEGAIVQGWQGDAAYGACVNDMKNAIDWNVIAPDLLSDAAVCFFDVGGGCSL